MKTPLHHYIKNSDVRALETTIVAKVKRRFIGAPWLVSGGIVLGLVVAVGLVFHFSLYWPLHLEKPIAVQITEGVSGKDVAMSLVDAGAGSSWWRVYYAAKVTGTANTFQAGEYQIHTDDSLVDALRRIAGGQVSSTEVRLTIPEGFTLSDVVMRMEELGYVIPDNYWDAAAMSERFPEYGFLADIPAGQTVEGYLFPDTYFVDTDKGLDAAVTKILANFDNKVTPTLRAKAEADGFTLHHVVTLAGIVEKEVHQADAPPVVSGIFHNRLAIGMKLESDATVNYVTGKAVLRPTAFDITVESPYNTYKYGGLPPGPIANPGLLAIEAAVNPAQTDFYYFITTPADEVKYGRTFSEHAANIRKYLD